MTKGERFLCSEGKSKERCSPSGETEGFQVKICTIHVPDAVEGWGCA